MLVLFSSSEMMKVLSEVLDVQTHRHIPLKSTNTNLRGIPRTQNQSGSETWKDEKTEKQKQNSTKLKNKKAETEPGDKKTGSGKQNETSRRRKSGARRKKKSSSGLGQTESEVQSELLSTQ